MTPFPFQILQPLACYVFCPCLLPGFTSQPEGLRSKTSVYYLIHPLT